MCEEDVKFKQQQVADYLREKMGFELILPESAEVTRVLDKLAIHEEPVSSESIQFIIDEYGDEVLSPIKEVIYDEY